MKKILIIILIISSFKANATTYFVSNSGNDNNNGLSAGFSWASISKVNSFFSSLNPGDFVLFNRGDVFYGTITPTVSGTASNSITIGAYGTGNKPIITGLVSATGTWSPSTQTNTFTNSTTFNPQSKPIFVLKDGVPQEVSRFPNVGAAGTDNGYLKISSVGSSTSTTYTFTSNNFPSSINWTGATIVSRSYHFRVDRGVITNNTGGTFIYNKGFGGGPQVNFGFFITNDLRACDQNGEWVYDQNNHVSMYGSSHTNVQVPTKDYLIELTGRSNIKVTDIDFEGANIAAVNSLSGSTNLSITNCTINFCGKRSVALVAAQSCSVTDNDMNYSMSMGIQYKNGANAIIRRNNIYNNGVFIGMIADGGGEGAGINLANSSGYVEYNNVINSGYNNIAFGGRSGQYIQYNYLKNSCLVMDDGGGIYSVSVYNNGSSDDPSTYTNRFVRWNIVDAGNYTAYHGTPNSNDNDWVAGIYLDNYSKQITVSGNTVIKYPIGIVFHHSIQCTMTDNVLFGCFYKPLFLNNDRVNYTTGTTVTGNTIFSTKTTGNIIYVNNIQSTNDINTIGTFDNNTYLQPLNQGDLKLYASSGQTNTSAGYSLQNWKSMFAPWDANSSATPPIYFSASDNPEVVFMLPFNKTTVVQNYGLNGKKWKGVDGTVYDNSITMQPYKSVPLMLMGSTGTPAPPPNTDTVPIILPPVTIDTLPPVKVRIKYIIR